MHRRAALLLRAALPLLLCALPVRAFAQSTTSFIPMLTGAGTEFSAGISNPTIEEAVVTMTARGYDGAAISGAGIQNPATLRLPASTQLARRYVELFGEGIAGRRGWVEVTASSPAVRGFFLVHDSGFGSIDGAGFIQTRANRLVFPRVDRGTWISFVNTGNKDLSSATLSIYDNLGNLVARKGFPLARLTGVSGTVAELIPEGANAEGYAVLDSSVGPFRDETEALAGLLTYRKGGDLAVSAALPDVASLRSGYVAHFVTGGGYNSRLALINPTFQAQRVRVTAGALVTGGVVRTPASVTEERTIPALGRVEEPIDRLFGLPGDVQIEGFVNFETTGSGAGVLGLLEFSSSGGLLSVVPAQGSGLSDVVFSQISENRTFYTGLVLLNTNSQPASVALDAFDNSGRRTGSASLRLAPGGRRVGLLSELIAETSGQDSGYLRVSASRPVVAVELFGLRSALNVLANVPAQGAALRAQSGRQPVVASAGAQVFSSTGTASLRVPPGALSSDTVVRLEELALTTLPAPAADRRVVGAVEALPSGTRFRAPVKLTFSLATDLTPGTSLPLMILDPATSRYEESGFTAIVDDSGRTASGDVTHFTTYAVTMPSSQLLTLSRVAPPTAPPGTAVTISGSGFSETPSNNIVTFAGPDSVAIRGTVTAASTTSLTVAVPANAVTGYLTVRVAGRSSVGVPFTVLRETPRPSIGTFTPASVMVGVTSLELEVSGSGFETVSTVSYDGAPSAVSYLDSGTLLLSLSGTQLNGGVHRIAVTNPAPGGGTSPVAEFTVSYPTPVLTLILPASVDGAVPTEVTLTGKGFTSGSVILIDGKTYPTTLVNATTVKATVSNLVRGTREVSVTNPAPGGGASNTINLLVRRVVPISSVLLVDPASGALLPDITVRMNETFQARPVVIDAEGQTRQDVTVSLASLNPAVAAVDGTGTFRGISRGFATFVAVADTAVTVGTVTVVEQQILGINEGASGAAEDGANLYLTSATNHTVLLVQGLTQQSVYAGKSRVPGHRDAARLDSEFNAPSSLALDRSKDAYLFVSDAGNHSIRRVSREGVETVAGTGVAGLRDGPVQQAQFNLPRGVARDRANNLWVADTENHVIRRINLITGIVETIAGRPGTPGSSDGVGAQALFRSPAGIAVETETELQRQERARTLAPAPPVRVIVADTGNGLIRRIDENGSVETLLAIGAALAVIPEGKGDQVRSALRVRPVALTFSNPTGVAVDPLGNIYVTESGSGRVSVIFPNGRVSSAAPPNTFQSPRGISVSQTGRFVVADSNAVVEIRYGAPQITGVSPGRVSSKGGESVTITGNNFAPDTVVVIGGVLVRGVNVENTQRLTFTAPAAPSGLTTLSVQNRGGIAQRSILIEATPLTSLPARFITTFAGGTTFGGDGSFAVAASISPPWGIATDSDGNVYIAETTLHRVRRVNPRTGVIITVAGTGQAGFSGDGGPSTAAALYDPVGLAIDRGGNLFIADTSNDRVRRVDAVTGIITTVAGDGRKGFAGDNGPAAAASLFFPFGIAVDGSGNLYIADTANSRVRKVTTSTGIISTVAGSALRGFAGDNGAATAAALNFPRGVTVDGPGNLYILDSSNYRVRKVASSNGVITTVAGNGFRGYGGDGGPAVSASIEFAYGLTADAAGNLFIVDTFNYRVRRVSAADGKIATMAGNGVAGFSGDGGPATSAMLREPAGVAVDAAGDVYVMDTFNNRARKVSGATGTIQTIAGRGAGSFAGDAGPATLAAMTLPWGIALDATGNLYIADTFNQRIRKVTAPAGTIATVAGNGERGFSGDNGAPTSAALALPYGVAVDGAGNIYIADTENNRVRKVTSATGTITTVAGNGQQGFSGDNGAATSASLSSPYAVAADTAGNLYIADTGNNRIRKVTIATGVISTVAGNGFLQFSGDGGAATAAGVYAPYGLAIDAAGNLYITDPANSRVRKVTVATGIITTIAGAGQRGFSGDNGVATSARLAEPYGVTVDNAGNVLVADSFNNRIRRVAAGTGIITTVAGGGSSLGDNNSATAAALNNPRAVAIDLQGNLYIADWFNGRVRVVRGPVF